MPAASGRRNPNPAGRARFTAHRNHWSTGPGWPWQRGISPWRSPSGARHSRRRQHGRIDVALVSAAPPPVSWHGASRRWANGSRHHRTQRTDFPFPLPPRWARHPFSCARDPCAVSRKIRFIPAVNTMTSGARELRIPRTVSPGSPARSVADGPPAAAQVPLDSPQRMGSCTATVYPIARGDHILCPAVLPSRDSRTRQPEAPVPKPPRQSADARIRDLTNGFGPSGEESPAPGNRRDPGPISVGQAERNARRPECRDGTTNFEEEEDAGRRTPLSHDMAQ